MEEDITGLSSCPCGEPIMGKLTGRIQKCDKHPGSLCWLWEWEAGTICPNCGTTQLFLHQPESPNNLRSRQSAGVSESDDEPKSTIVKRSNHA